MTFFYLPRGNRHQGTRWCSQKTLRGHLVALVGGKGQNFKIVLEERLKGNTKALEPVN